MLCKWVWIMVSSADPVLVNHSGVCCASDCESWWGLLSQWFVNHGVLCCTSAPESWRVILNQWLCIIVSYAEPVVENHVLFYWASGCESWSVMLCQWFWIMLCYAFFKLGITVWTLCQWVIIMLCYSELVVGNNDVNAVPVGVNHVELCFANGWESWRIIIYQWLWIM